MGIFNFNENRPNVHEEVEQEKNNIRDIHHFSEKDKIYVANCMQLLKNEVYIINNQITLLLRKFSLKYSESENPQYAITYNDYRYFYEELVNLVLLKYIRQCDETKRYFIKSKSVKEMNTKKKDNPYNVDFMPYLVYNSYLINEVLEGGDFRKIMIDMEKSIQKITMYNHNVVQTEIKYFMNEANINEIKINDYKIMFNTQMYNTISNFMVHSNICKNFYFKQMVNEANLSEQKK